MTRQNIPLSPSPKNYAQTLEYMYAQLPMYHRVGAQAYKANLDNTIALCRLLGNPQNSFRSVHIAGTNGKGSVSHILASILQHAGFRTGLYTSPHLKDFRERIRVDGKMVPKYFVTNFIQAHRQAFERIHPSFFELTVGMAFEWFREQQVDIAIVEVGLGGRLDSTNIITPLVSVITNIGFDHMQFLGKTLAEIAAEKAGIIKRCIPVVIGETQAETEPVFREIADKRNAPILFANQRYRVEKFRLKVRNTKAFRTMDIYDRDQVILQDIVSPLAGIYQRKNIVTVIGACQVLHETGFSLSSYAIKKGILNVIRKTGLAGRWQILGTNPLTICDTGHNESGLREVVAQLAATPHRHLHFVFGVVNDKALDLIFDILPRDATYYFCKPGIPRGLDEHQLQEQAAAAGMTGHTYPSVKTALEAARANAAEDDLVFVGGSTFVVAEVV